MKKQLLAAIAVVMIGGWAGTGEAGAASYSYMIAKTCSLQSPDTMDRFFDGPMRLSRSSIRIKGERRIGRGWKRIYASGRVDGAFASGFVEYHPRSGRLVCDANDWHVNKMQMMKRKHRR